MAIYIPQIIDNLLSESTKDGLSANQGRVLKNEHGNLNDLMTQEGATFVVNGEEREYADIWHAKKDE